MTAYDTLGVFRGSNRPLGVTQFEAVLHRRIPGPILDFTGGKVSSWTQSRQHLSACLSAWSTRCVHGPDTLMLSIHGWPWQLGPRLSLMAAGAYDNEYRADARLMKSRGYDHRNLILRPMWEFNGRFYPWSVRVGNAPSFNNGSNYSVNARNFVNGWRRMVTAYRSIIPGLRFVWCPLRGQDTPRNVEMCWPGNAYVSMVGFDAYNHGPARLTPDQRWNALVTGGGGNWPGLDWHAKFAAAQSRPLSFPEWGVVQRNDGTGGADDPNYVRRFLGWVDCHNVHSHCYFEKDAADARHQLHDYPGQPAVVKFPRSRTMFDALMMEA